MQTYRFSYVTVDKVTNSHFATVEVPDDVEDVEEYIEQHIQDWKYDEFDDVIDSEQLEGPSEIEVG
jgi:hypothetical protein